MKKLTAKMREALALIAAGRAIHLDSGAAWIEADGAADGQITPIRQDTFGALLTRRLVRRSWGDVYLITDKGRLALGGDFLDEVRARRSEAAKKAAATRKAAPAPVPDTWDDHGEVFDHESDAMAPGPTDPNSRTYPCVGGPLDGRRLIVGDGVTQVQGILRGGGAVVYELVGDTLVPAVFPPIPPGESGNAPDDCLTCQGTGNVNDWVDYGSTTIPMPSACDDCDGTGKVGGVAP